MEVGENMVTNIILGVIAFMLVFIDLSLGNIHSAINDLRRELKDVIRATRMR